LRSARPYFYSTQTEFWRPTFGPGLIAEGFKEQAKWMIDEQKNSMKPRYILTSGELVLGHAQAFSDILNDATKFEGGAGNPR